MVVLSGVEAAGSGADGAGCLVVVGGCAPNSRDCKREMTRQKLGLAVIAILLAAGLVLGTMYTAGWKLRDASEPATDQGETTATAPAWGDRLERVATVAILIGGLIALGVASWRAWSANQQSDAARKQVETALQQVQTSQQQVRSAQRQADTAYQGLLNERYQKGAEMLGSNTLAVRLAGIYALGQLADDHPEQYYVQVMQLLSAFVRHSPVSDSPRVKASDSARVDVRETVAWIGDHRNHEIENGSEYAIDLTGAYLREASLSSADLSSTLMNSAVLQEAFLHKADLSGAFLTEANLNEAFLALADFTDAQLAGC